MTLANADGSRSHQFEFVLADIPDLDGVDAALGRLIRGGELSLRAIDDFIMRSRHYLTAARYRSGLANYLYGVLAREGLPSQRFSTGRARSGTRQSSTKQSARSAASTELLRRRSAGSSRSTTTSSTER